MVRFLLDMSTSIVILACFCNELRDFVAFDLFQTVLLCFGSPPAAYDLASSALPLA